MARLETYLGGGKLETHPLALFGQRTHVDSLVSIHLSPSDLFVSSPNNAMIPATNVELQHDGLRWVFGIKVAMNEEFSAARDSQGSAFGEHVLAPGVLGRTSDGTFAAEYRPFLLCD